MYLYIVVIIIVGISFMEGALSKLGVLHMKLIDQILGKKNKYLGYINQMLT